MRSSKSRSRNKPGRNRSNTVGNVVNRVFDSSGPESKVRGTPQQIIEKYNQLARDAQLANDRVAAENFQQHAEHYLRLLGAAQKEQDARREQQERENRDRQAERDRERQEQAERDRERQEREGQAQQDDGPEGDQPKVVEAGGGDPGLVETPENQVPEKPKRARKPRRKPEPSQKADEASPPSKAAE